MRSGRPVVCGDVQAPGAIERIAREKGAFVHQIHRDFTFYRQDRKSWRFSAGDVRIDDLPNPALFGSVQFNNAACALHALHMLADRLPLDHAAIENGLRQVRLPGRFQLIADHPVTVILDIAHNPGSARVLANNLRSMPCCGKTHAIFSVLSDKDVVGIFEAVKDQIDVWHLLELKTGRALRLDVLHDYARETLSGKPLHIHSSSLSALNQAMSSAVAGDRIVVFGSVVIVAEAQHCGYN